MAERIIFIIKELEFFLYYNSKMQTWAWLLYIAVLTKYFYLLMFS